jgi:hypothetical protein
LPIPQGLTLPGNVTLAEKDKPILLGAVHSRATHLLSGDKQHFGHLFGQEVSGVLVLTPALYLLSRKQTE